MNIKTVGLVTYDHPHLKTEQVIPRLLQKHYRLKIYALPFVERDVRPTLFNHRPDQTQSVNPIAVAEAHAIPFLRCETDTEIDDSCDVYLVLAGKILSPECIEGKYILNCHPGIIPAVRGLDAFKWAIWEKRPLGVTLHFIDREVDKGEVVAVVRTPTYPGDTLQTLARRHYENELSVQCSFEDFLRAPVNNFKKMKVGEAHRRMGSKIESEMIRTFDAYVRAFSSRTSSGQELMSGE